MKQLLLLLACLVTLAATAQTTELAPDQNPNYLISQQKYMQYKDSLQVNMNTTIQQTYKAYDWYEAKLERKQNRIENRNQRRLYRNYYAFAPNPYDYYGFNRNGFSNRFNNNRFGLTPFIGYRTGNWWFWF
jgi:hypothetical protein